MKLTVNGAEREFHGQTVRDLVADLGLGAAAVAVEVNMEVVPRREPEKKTLRDGDKVEVVTLVGGG
ncbi:MAG: sulfur carrier protein ThiS [Phycisphaeraceae bacterium]|nr:sulfur carrier protein ThiS [Phycisphaeraceae bacterium]